MRAIFLFPFLIALTLSGQTTQGNAGPNEMQFVPAPVPEDLQAKASSGDAKAQFELGLFYDDGKGLPKDSSKAVFWYCKAAD